MINMMMSISLKIKGYQQKINSFITKYKNKADSKYGICFIMK